MKENKYKFAVLSLAFLILSSSPLVAEIPQKRVRIMCTLMLMMEALFFN